jgi:hypothetical protein
VHVEVVSLSFSGAPRRGCIVPLKITGASPLSLKKRGTFVSSTGFGVVGLDLVEF